LLSLPYKITLLLQYILDIYVRLIIAVFGFIAPAVTLLMPILSGKISEFRRLIEEEQEVSKQISNSLIEEYKSSLSSVPDSALKEELNRTVKKHVASRTKQFNVNLRKLEKNTKRLNLKWQIKNIFGFLILSLIFVMIAHSTVDDFKYKEAAIDKWFYISIGSLILSVSAFAYALFRIWTLICIVVNHNFDKASVSSDSRANESKIIGSDNVVDDNVITVDRVLTQT